MGTEFDSSASIRNHSEKTRSGAVRTGAPNRCTIAGVARNMIAALSEERTKRMVQAVFKKVGLSPSGALTIDV